LIIQIAICLVIKLVMMSDVMTVTKRANDAKLHRLQLTSAQYGFRLNWLDFETKGLERLTQQSWAQLIE